MSTSEDLGRSSYLDLLIAVLSQHEKNMSKIVEKMEKLSKDVTKVEPIKKETEKEGFVTNKEEIGDSAHLDTVIYMKISPNRPLDEVLKVLKDLKE